MKIMKIKIKIMTWAVKIIRKWTERNAWCLGITMIRWKETNSTTEDLGKTENYGRIVTEVNRRNWRIKYKDQENKIRATIILETGNEI